MEGSKYIISIDWRNGKYSVMIRLTVFCEDWKGKSYRTPLQVVFPSLFLCCSLIFLNEPHPKLLEMFLLRFSKFIVSYCYRLQIMINILKSILCTHLIKSFFFLFWNNFILLKEEEGFNVSVVNNELKQKGEGVNLRFSKPAEVQVNISPLYCYRLQIIINIFKKYVLT